MVRSRTIGLKIDGVGRNEKGFRRRPVTSGKFGRFTLQPIWSLNCAEERRGQGDEWELVSDTLNHFFFMESIKLLLYFGYKMYQRVKELPNLRSLGIIIYQLLHGK